MKKNINFLMHKFQQNHKHEITDNNIILYKINFQKKMKYTLITKENDNLTKENESLKKRIKIQTNISKSKNINRKLK